MLERFRLSWRLRVQDGEIRLLTGKPPAGFINNLRDVLQLHGIEQGEIECKGRGKHARLRFSRDFPERGRQAIRNGWTPPTAPGPASGSRRRG